MPVWHETTRRWVRDGRLVLLGITQEQHPDRTRLFAQWHRFDWPILWDPLNLMGLNGVPVVVAIDEYGVVRQIGPSPETLEAKFLNHAFPKASPEAGPIRAKKPDIPALRRQALVQDSGEAWRRLGDALALWGPPARIDDALHAYRRALQRQPQDSDSLFRLGVCYRMRYDSSRRQTGDFQKAVDLWGQALAVRPNVYIWRRRLQQYGPRLEKPYPFYDWVAQAVADIRARGENPLRLSASLNGAEIAQPASAVATPSPTMTPPDPKGKIQRDTHRLVQTEAVIVPSLIRPGKSARILISFTPDPRRQVFWNNEAEPLRLWIDPPAGWQVSGQFLAAPQGVRPETQEVRRLDFEVQAPPDASGPVHLRAYALYYVCEGLQGRCLFRRQDMDIVLPVHR